MFKPVRPMPSRTLSFVLVTLTQHQNHLRPRHFVTPLQQSNHLHCFQRRPRPGPTLTPPLNRPFSTTTKCLSQTSTRPNQQVSILPLQVIQRIASGEVITGYDAVIQELVENSIDAQATSISIDLDLATNSITVSDNGIGISLQQGLLSVANCNATSKLHSLQQLHDGVQTLGFRGQGLWSIAVTARTLSISSCIEQHAHGTTVRFSKDGHPVQDSVKPVPMATGTVVSAAGLPWTLSGRQLSKAVSACKSWLLRAALCHPSISFRLSRNKQSYWARPAGRRDPNTARILSLAGEFRASAADFRQASVTISSLGVVDVVAGIPSMVHSASKSSVMTAVNGRCVMIDELSAAISRCMSVKRGRYPVVFVHLSVPRGVVDWNVSPVKSIARFKDAGMMAVVEREVAGIISDMMRGMPVSEVVAPAKLENDELPIAARETKVLQRLLSLLPSNSAVKQAAIREHSSPASGQSLTTPNLRNARVVAQLLQTYLLIEYDGGIILAEQHIADERFIYEELLRTWKASQFSQLREPLRLPGHMSEETLFSLESLGFGTELEESTSESNKPSVHLVRSVPGIMKDLPHSVLGPLLLRLCSEASSIEEAAAAVSCRLATKNGKQLGLQRLGSIFSNLMQCENPYTCPHGRPIFVDLPARELAQLFGRSWLPERFNTSLPERRDISRGVLPE